MNHCPPQKQKAAIILGIPLHIPSNLFNPIPSVIAFLKLRLFDFPVLSVKKLTIAKDGYLLFRQNYIRFTRQVFIIFSISISTMP